MLNLDAILGRPRTGQKSLTPQLAGLLCPNPLPSGRPFHPRIMGSAPLRLGAPLCWSMMKSTPYFFLRWSQSASTALFPCASPSRLSAPVTSHYTPLLLCSATSCKVCLRSFYPLTKFHMKLVLFHNFWETCRQITASWDAVTRVRLCPLAHLE